jgi:hypothetical protein
MTNNYLRGGGFLTLSLPWTLAGLRFLSFAIARVGIAELEKGKLREVKA